MVAEGTQLPAPLRYAFTSVFVEVTPSVSAGLDVIPATTAVRFEDPTAAPVATPVPESMT